MSRALIVGVAGTELTAPETRFLREVRPCGLILFSRNCAGGDQIRGLVAAARAAAGDDLLVSIDQEGGRVQRLRPPLGRVLAPAAAYATRFVEDPDRARRAAFAVARLVADDLRALGIDTNCAPVLDVPVHGSHDIIGDRAYGASVASVAALGRAVAEGYSAGGVVPIIKHIPGHGRATADSHLALPRVAASRADLTQTDFAPFRLLADLPVAMTAHVVFEAIDPHLPASISPRAHAEVIRGEIGFDGLLMSDDISMHALSGPFDGRAAAVLAAGSDIVLHCNGDLAEMQAAAAATPVLAGEARRRLERACAVRSRRQPFDAGAAEGDLAWVLAAESVRLGLP